MPSYKLFYFKVRGRAEVCRLAFSAANIDFEDCRLDGEEWAKLKQSGKPPFGQMPLLEEDERVLAQSGAIAKYICKRAGLSPDDVFEEAKADMICGAVDDLRSGVVKFFLEKDEEKKEELKKQFFEKTLPDQLKNFQACLEKAGSGFFAGGKLTYADINVFDFLHNILAKGEPDVPEVLNGFPALKEHYSRVLNNPGIKAWVEKRPKTEY